MGCTPTRLTEHQHENGVELFPCMAVWWVSTAYNPPLWIAVPKILTGTIFQLLEDSGYAAVETPEKVRYTIRLNELYLNYPDAEVLEERTKLQEFLDSVKERDQKILDNSLDFKFDDLSEDIAFGDHV